VQRGPCSKKHLRLHDCSQNYQCFVIPDIDGSISCHWSPIMKVVPMLLCALLMPVTMVLAAKQPFDYTIGSLTGRPMVIAHRGSSGKSLGAAWRNVTRPPPETTLHMDVIVHSMAHSLCDPPAGEVPEHTMTAYQRAIDQVGCGLAADGGRWTRFGCYRVPNQRCTASQP
jgi:hypothetical protein